MIIPCLGIAERWSVGTLETPDTKMAPDRGGDTDAILVAGVGFEPTTFWL